MMIQEHHQLWDWYVTYIIHEGEKKQTSFKPNQRLPLSLLEREFPAHSPVIYSVVSMSSLPSLFLFTHFPFQQHCEKQQALTIWTLKQEWVQNKG